jgi:hypothetical protein
VIRLGQAAVGPDAAPYPAVTLDGGGLRGAPEPQELARQLRRGFRCNVAAARRADGVRFEVAIESPLALRFAFDVRYAEPFSDSFIGGAMITGHIVVSFSTLPAVARATPAGEPFVETEGLVFPLPAGALTPAPTRR